MTTIVAEAVEAGIVIAMMTAADTGVAMSTRALTAMPLAAMIGTQEEIVAEVATAEEATTGRLVVRHRSQSAADTQATRVIRHHRVTTMTAHVVTTSVATKVGSLA